MKLLKQVPSIFTNKYLISGLFFLVWMIFFDEKDLGSDINKRSKFKELEKSEQHLGNLIVECKSELDQLKTNTQTIVKYARENYLMKKDNEDLFILSTGEKVK